MTSLILAKPSYSLNKVVIVKVLIVKVEDNKEGHLENK